MDRGKYHSSNLLGRPQARDGGRLELSGKTKDKSQRSFLIQPATFLVFDCNRDTEGLQHVQQFMRHLTAHLEGIQLEAYVNYLSILNSF